MIKYILPAAIAAVALGTLAGAPAIGHAQLAQPMPPQMPTNATNANATIIGQPQPGPDDQAYGQVPPGPMQPMPGLYGQPAPAMMQPGFSPRTTWIPGHYDWNPNTSNYVYTGGQYVEAPRENAQWIPGHWVQTPTSWIWLEGSWN
jgi:hypothetical protein